MAKKVLRLVIVVVVVLAAWAIGHLQAQSPTVDSWEIQIVAPTGRTTIRCVKGCDGWDNPETWFQCRGGETCPGSVGQHGLVIHH